MRKQRRPRATFDFVPEGRFQKEAEVARLQARYGEQRGPGGRRFGGPGAGGQPAWLQASAGGDANQVPLGPKMALAAEAAALPAQAVEQVVELEEVPEVEWWDRRLLEHESYAAALLPDGGVALKAGRVTHLVEHPVPLEPPRPEVAPPPQPLKLTSRELKKLRTQRRVAREKEKQELLRQGLLEAPAPRVKISNLHRVLGMEAAADPTAIEQEVRRQMAERLAAHEDRNLARKLTPAEAREKKLRKMFDQAPAGLEGAGVGPELYCAVYRIASLANPQHAYKVDVNAKENHMSGVVLVTDDFTLVVAEGVSKALKRYNKLMLRRIDWTQAKPAGAGVEEDAPGEDEDNEGVDPLARPNSCDLVWQGTVLGAAFPDFRVYKLGNPSAAKALLQQAGVGHYWDAAASFIPGGPAMEAML